MTTYATLELGDAADAMAWEKGCQSLGRMPAVSIMNPTPTLAQLKAFFTTEPEWVYFSGHIWGDTLYGHKTGTAQIWFRTVGVAINYGPEAVNIDEDAIDLLKPSDFTMQKSCSLIIIAGCSALRSFQTMRVIRELFFNPTILGYAEQCDVQMNTAMMGTGSNTFFANYRAGSDLVNAWLKGGLSIAPAKQTMFRAFDTDGQEWKLVNSRVVKGSRV